MATSAKLATRAQYHEAGPKIIPDSQAPAFLARSPMTGIIMFLIGSLVFGGLTYNLYAHGPLLAWDVALANTLPAIGLSSPVLVQSLMAAGFYIGKEVIVILGILIGIYFILKRYWQELAMLAIGLAGSSLLFLSLSALIGRPRPPTQIWILVNMPSFPSGHAIAVVTFYGLLAYLLVSKMRSIFWKVMVVAAALLVILFVGFSRVFTAGHYLTDILAGYAVGVSWSGAAYTLIETYFQKRRSQNVKKE